MNILIVSENFTRGGLETQIYTQYSEMKNENKFVFAFSNYESKLDFEDSKIYTNFNFKYNASVDEFCEDVERLIKIIKEEKIDIINCHPFYSVFPAVFAAKITNTKVVYTVHGYISFNFPSRINDCILFQSFIETEIEKIFAVSEECKNAINSSANSTNRSVLIQNAVDTKKYKEKRKIKNNKVWAFISRIEKEKIKVLEQIMENMDFLDIKEIHIYGDGSEKNSLPKFINEKKLQDRVLIFDHSDNLYEQLDNKYNGIIGIGRVALEALSMGFPCLLIGYRKNSRNNRFRDV